VIAMPVPAQIVEFLSATAFKYVSEEIRALGQRSTAVDNPDHIHPVKPGAEPVPGCPACRVHDAASTAKGHLDGIVAMGSERGQIPDVMRPEMLLVSKDLEKARASVEVVRARAPALGDQCDRIASTIDAAASTLPEPDALTMDNARTSLAALEAVHKEATGLAVQYYELERSASDADAIRKWYEDARTRNLDADTALSKLREALANG
jgi:hypothetical protein